MIYIIFCVTLGLVCGLIIEDKICDDSLKIITALGDGDKAETLNMTCDRHAKMLMSLPPAQPNNQVNLCDSCKYSYPDCPSEADDVIFGNGKGNDNICACNKYLPPAQPEPRKGKWILHEEIKGFPDWKCSECGGSGRGDYHYCPWCMAAME